MADLTLTTTFQERVYERIRDSIGELMSEEDLKRLVDAAVRQAFFERQVKKDSYGRTVEDRAPWIVEEVAKLLRERVSQAVKEWVDTHPDEIGKILNEAIAKGMTGLVLSYFEQKISWPLQEFAMKLQNGGLG